MNKHLLTALSALVALTASTLSLSAQALDGRLVNPAEIDF